MEWAAQKGDGSPNGFAAGKAGNRLVYHRLKNRGGKVGFCGTFVDQRLDVGFGKDSASGGDGVNSFVVCGLGVQALCIRLQQACHLIDKRTGSACADTVHPFFQTAFEIDDFGVFTTQFDGHIGLRCGFLQGCGNGHNLLHKADV